MSHFLVERRGSVEHWTLSDPASRNALSDAMVAGLSEACLRAKHDTALRVVVLGGAAGAFCAGGSLGGFASAIGQPLQPGESDPLLAVNRGFGDVLHALCELPQLLLCAVDGPAMGGGFGLVCCADHVLATERSVFGTPEVTLGLPPAQIAPFVWQRLGDAAARECLLLGRRYSAAQARTLGLVNEVVADDALSVAIDQTLQSMVRSAPGAVASTKRLLQRLREATPDLRHESAQAFTAALRSPEAAAGLPAFARRQPPPWAGSDTGSAP